MKKQKFIRFVAFILLILMIVPIVCMTISAKGGSTAGSSTSSSASGKTQKAPADSPKSEKQGNTTNTSTPYRISSWMPKNPFLKDVNPSYAYSQMKTVNNSILRVQEFSEDPSLESFVEAFYDISSDVMMLFGPVGQVLSATIDFVQIMSHLDDSTADNGVPPRSELQDLQDTMLLEFDKMNEQLTDIERELNGLSEEINASTNEIISSLTTHIDNTAAKEYLEEFMLSSGIGDFGYNQFRNYIYGAAQNNASGATAYYALAKQSIRNGASDEEVRYYYDQLYTALMDYREAYKDYLLGTDTGKSVIEYYYDVVSANPELLSENLTPEEMTVLFAYDLYQTEFMANQILLACNTRYLTYMLDSGTDTYCYDQASGRYITKDLILGDNGIDSMAESAEIRTTQVEKCIAEALMYVFAPESYYTLQYKNGKIQFNIKGDDDTYGYILPDACSYVYFDTVPEWAAQYIGLDPADFKVKTDSTATGIVAIDSYTDTVTAGYYYKDTLLTSLTVRVDDSARFMGGDGSGENPYLVGTKAQFLSIKDGLDKHYRIISDIDFEGEVITSIGHVVNKDGTVSYLPFTGSLDGAGYTLSNLVIHDTEYLGLFAIVEGEICNMVLHNFIASTEEPIKDAKSALSFFYAGVVAGENRGTIKYCRLHNDAEKIDVKYHKKTSERFRYGVEFRIDNKTLDRSLYVYAGGIAGRNKGTISYCEISNTRVDVSSKHDFEGQAVEKNTNNVYGGGICGDNLGTVRFCYVSAANDVMGYLKLTADPTKKIYPYAELYMGGICGKTDMQSSVISCKSDFETYEDVDATIYYVSESENEISNKNFKQRTRRSTYYANYSSIPESKYDGEMNLGELIEANIDYYNVEIDFGSTQKNDHAYETGNTVDRPLTYVSTQSSAGATFRHLFESEALGYVLEMYENSIGKLTLGDTTVEFSYVKNTDGTVSATSSELYNLGVRSIECNFSEKTAKLVVANVFNEENIKVYHEGKEVDFTILQIYGFDVLNETLELLESTAHVLFAIDLEDGYTVYKFETVDFSVSANKIEKLELLGVKKSYRIGEFSLDGLKLAYTYTTGMYEELSLPANAYYTGDANTYGDQALTLFADENVIPFTVHVVCNHSDNFTDPASGYVRREDLCIAPTCSERGEDIYACSTCGDLKKVYLEKLAHIPSDDLLNDTSASCQKVGYSGDVVCAACAIVLDKGHEIPALAHSYKYHDSSYHICVNCSAKEYHHYTVEERTEYTNDGGIPKYTKVYYKSCICDLDGEVYVKKVVDTNEIVPEMQNMPTIVVTNGYVLENGLDENIVVYIRLENNPGVLGANFGIRYDNGLELLFVEDGNVFEGSMVAESSKTNHGYNFLWANSSSNVRSADGVLLKLTFRVLPGAKLGDTFAVNVVYGESKTHHTNKNINGGFEFVGINNGTAVKVPAVSGLIKVVDHLPGDVNDDGKVDIIDAIMIAKSIVTQGEYYVDERYANVDLSVPENLDDWAIGTSDVITILNYITGSAGLPLVDDEFDILLDTGIPEVDMDSVHVSMYDDQFGENLGIVNNRYDKFINTVPTREGYKFLGWSFAANGEILDLTSPIIYNRNQRQQTLYAVWEVNSIEFSPNGANVGEMSTVYYGYSGEVNVSLRKEYLVYFMYSANTVQAKLEYTIDHWVDQYGNIYSGVAQAVSQMNSTSIGKITLMPIWSEKPKLDYPENTALKGYEGPYWKNADYDTVIPGVNDADIITDPTKREHVLVASYTAKVYYLEFKGEGVVIPEQQLICSGDSPYNLSLVTVNRFGYSFKGWTAKVGGEIIIKNLSSSATLSTDFSSLPSGTTVTLEPQWELLTHKITYNLNGGALKSESNVFTFSVESEALPKVSVVHAEYESVIHFTHWCTNKTCKSTSSSCANALTLEWLKQQKTDVTVYAQWDLVAIKKMNQANQNIMFNDTRIILDFRGRTVTTPIKITLENVTDVYFVGDKSVAYSNIDICFRSTKSTTQKVNINFYDFNVTDSTFRKDGTSSYAITANVYFQGTNKVTAPVGSEAFVDFKQIDFRGSGSIYVKGGKGNDGAHGADFNMGDYLNESDISSTTQAESGADGAAGHYAISFTTSVNAWSGTITLVGGDGGNGGNGGNVLGESNRDGNYDLPDGGKGGRGGNGGMPVNFMNFYATDAIVTIMAGNGGNGGNGGKGGDAREVDESRPDGFGNGGRGGNGGHGFIGGNGGNGGNGGTSYNSDSNKNSKGTSGNSGNGGNGGNSVVGIYIIDGYLDDYTLGATGKGGEAGALDATPVGNPTAGTDGTSGIYDFSMSNYFESADSC